MPRFVSVAELFKGRHFDQEIVVRCVRWYLSYKLSYRDLVAMMGERWVQYYTPEFEQRWNRFARTVGGSWRMDETYVKVRAEWVYLCRAVDKAGNTVDFYLSRRRDVNAARAFLRKAMKAQRTPTKITLDAYAASHRAVAEAERAPFIGWHVVSLGRDDFQPQCRMPTERLCSGVCRPRFEPKRAPEVGVPHAVAREL